MPEPPSEARGRPVTPDIRLAEALKPAVQAALKRSVRDEPQVWAEAIFPILMPAIRLAVAAALRGMVQTLNQVLEHSLSLRSWRWRVEAWRTGKSFAEVLLARTLVYRVAQVLLVHRYTGLLVVSASSEPAAAKDADQISAMLTALEEFARDSFDAESSGGIHELRVGDFILLVEQGPYAGLAAAVRGTPPAALRETLRAAVDLVHQECGSELRDFRGDNRAPARCTEILNACLQSQYQDPVKGSYRKLKVIAATVALLLLAWAGVRIMEARRWNRAVAALRGAPGIAIGREGREGGRYYVDGLRDPLAGPPEGILAEQGIDARKVSLNFRPYLSLEPELAIRHALIALDAPGTVTATLDQGVLAVKGAAAHDWIAHAAGRSASLTMAGIRAIDLNGVEDLDMARLRAKVESARILFGVGSSALTETQTAAARQVAADTARWYAATEAAGRRPLVTVMGSCDPSGTEHLNTPLSRNRAGRFAEFLRAAGIPPDALEFAGQDSANATSLPATDYALRRSASIRLSLRQPASVVGRVH